MMNIRGTEFDFSGTSYVMGILNVTPDSFSDGGLHNSTERAVEHTLNMIKEGAAIIDIGGESTRPGYEGISAEEEQKRVIPVITALRNVSSVPISIDTTKPEVASAAVAAGADMINTVEGAEISDDMLDVVKETGAYLVMTYEKSYVNLFGEELIAMAERAVEYGIPQDKIIVDPGIGFGKTQDDNLRILNELPIITQIGYPILLGCSRKSVIGYALGTDSSDDKEQLREERMAPTVATTVLAALAGVGIIRVHDVGHNVRAIKMLEKICNSQTQI